MSQNTHEQPAPQQRHRRWIIHPYDRIYWDIFVLLVIIASAFEIPYDWLVGWKDERASTGFDIFFSTVFLADVLFNCFTMRERSFSGLWGVRHITGLFSVQWSPEHHQRVALERDPGLVMVLDDNASIVKGYTSSGWFVIDLLSAIPWGLIAASFTPLTSLRLLRLLRLARLFRVLRLTRAILLIERIRRAVPAVPSVERLLALGVTIPWLAHMLACLLYHAELRSGRDGLTYGAVFHSMWMAIIARRTTLPDVSEAGFFIGMIGIATSVLVIAAVTGNLAALYTSLDLGRLKKHHVVLEQHHIVIGWNNNVFSIIEQLSMADQQGAPGDIVLLSEREESEIWRELDEFGLSIDPRRLTIHTGSTQSVHNIRRLSVGRAQSVIVLGNVPDNVEGDEAAVFRRVDAEVLKTLLACRSAFNMDEWARVGRVGRGYLSIVAAVHSREMAEMLQLGIPRRGAAAECLDLHIVDTQDILARCIAQVASEPLLVDVFNELFAFNQPGVSVLLPSNEIYIVELDALLDARGVRVTPELLQRRLGERPCTFQALAAAMPSCIPIGIYAARDTIPAEHRALYATQRSSDPHVRTRQLFLNPGWRSDQRGARRPVPFESSYALGPGDALVVLALDQRSGQRIDLDALGSPCTETHHPAPIPPREPRHLAVLGDGRKARELLDLLPDFLPQHSEIVAEVTPPASPLREERCDARAIHIHTAPVTGRDPLDHSRDAALCRCDTVVVVSDEDERHIHDANILMSLTALEARHVRERGAGLIPAHRTHVVELLDTHNRALVESFGKVASIISPELVSDFLVQLTTDPERGLVYRELLDMEGNEIYIIPLARYQRRHGEDVCFDTLARRARYIGELAIGYTFRDMDGAEHVRLGPVGPRRFLSGTQLLEQFAERPARLVVIAPHYPETPGRGAGSSASSGEEE